MRCFFTKRMYKTVIGWMFNPTLYMLRWWFKQLSLDNFTEIIYIWKTGNPCSHSFHKLFLHSQNGFISDRFILVSLTKILLYYNPVFCISGKAWNIRRPVRCNPIKLTDSEQTETRSSHAHALGERGEGSPWWGRVTG